MKHNHHLIPKHLGGTNNPSNIVEGVSVIRHAMFHFANWQLWGSEGDLIAYRALSGSIGKEEIIEMVLSFAGKKGGIAAKESGQLREAALKQPRHVRQSIGKKLATWNDENRGKNKRNSREAAFNSRYLERHFHVHERMTERTIGKKLGTVIAYPGVDYSQVAEMIEEAFGVTVSTCHLVKLPLGDRIVHNGVTCSIGMAISSQAALARAEGSETSRCETLLT
jgi:hypothetical protein